MPTKNEQLQAIVDRYVSQTGVDAALALDVQGNVMALSRDTPDDQGRTFAGVFAKQWGDTVKNSGHLGYNANPSSVIVPYDNSKKVYMIFPATENVLFGISGSNDKPGLYILEAKDTIEKIKAVV